ncbi:MAG TPA: cupin domain-containing protein [Armatimonadetes bacterium]|nr:cupin domain-containing protein [Armatimonadota bacterium]
MKLIHHTQVPAEVPQEEARGVTVRWVIGQQDGALNFAMRVFEVEPNGYTPRHQHPWEHEVFILEGHGQVLGEGKWHDFGPGDVIYIPPQEEHQFRNPSDWSIKFLCLVPAPAYCGAG